MAPLWRDYEDIIQSAPLFSGIGSDDIDAMLNCLTARLQSAAKGEILLLVGEKPEYVGIALSGRLLVCKEDEEGRRFLVAGIGPGEVFAESLCCAEVGKSPVTVLAEEESTVLQLRLDKILHFCPNSCAYHTRLIENLVRLVAQKNLELQNRIDMISVRTVREKVLRYLRTFPHAKGSMIQTPFSREEMADYLCVERSALSHELSRMKQDGLIDYHKNIFKLL